MEIKKDPAIQGMPLKAPGGAPGGQEVALPEDTFTRGQAPSKSLQQFQQLASSGAAQVVLTPGKKEPVPVQKAAHWSYDAEDKHSIDAVFQTPAGTSFICCHSFDTEHRDTSRAYTVAFNDKGQEIWKYRADKRYSIDEHAFLADGSCYIVCNNDERWSKSYVVALNPDGTERWKFQPDTDEKCSSLLVGPDGTVYAKIESQLYALDKDSGAVKWNHKIGINADDYFQEISPDGTTILANDNFSNNFGYDIFYGIDAQGRKKEVDFPDIGTFPVRDDKGAIYYGGEKGEFYGINLSTQQKWQIDLDAERGLQTPHWGKDGKIYAQGRYDNKNLYAIDPQGKLLWQQKIEDHRPGGFATDTFYKVDKDGSVFYAIEDKDAIQQIDASGNRVRQIQVPGGFSEFVPDNRGNLYIRQHDDTIVFCNIESDQRFYFPMEIARNVEMKEVIDDGSLVFQGMCERYHVKLDKADEIKKLLEQAQKEDSQEPQKEHDEIIVDDNWVIIGNVKVPRR